MALPGLGPTVDRHAVQPHTAAEEDITCVVDDLAGLLIEPMRVEKELRPALDRAPAKGGNVLQKGILRALVRPVGGHPEYGRLALDRTRPAGIVSQHRAPVPVAAVVAGRVFQTKEELIGYEDRLAQPDVPYPGNRYLRRMIDRCRRCGVEAIGPQRSHLRAEEV